MLKFGDWQKNTNGGIEAIYRDLMLVGKRFLVMLFKCYENKCGWKSVVEIHVILFKQWKLLFK